MDRQTESDANVHGHRRAQKVNRKLYASFALTGDRGHHGSMVCNMWAKPEMPSNTNTFTK